MVERKKNFDSARVRSRRGPLEHLGAASAAGQLVPSRHVSKQCKNSDAFPVTMVGLHLSPLLSRPLPDSNGPLANFQENHRKS